MLFAARAIRLRFGSAIIIVLVSMNCSQSRLPDDTILAIIESTSFTDWGLKAIIFEDGKVFGCQRIRGSHGTYPEYFSMEISANQKLHLVTVFVDNRFFELPLSMSANNIDDGSEEWLVYADSNKIHHVRNYMMGNHDFTAAYEALRSMILAEQENSTEITSKELALIVAERMMALPENSPKRTAISLWLNQMADQYLLPRVQNN